MTYNCVASAVYLRPYHQHSSSETEKLSLCVLIHSLTHICSHPPLNPTNLLHSRTYSTWLLYAANIAPSSPSSMLGAIPVRRSALHPGRPLYKYSTCTQLPLHPSSNPVPHPTHCFCSYSSLCPLHLLCSGAWLYALAAGLKPTARARIRQFTCARISLRLST